MTIRRAAAGIMAAAVFGALGAQLDAAVIVPVKPYVKPGEPLAVRFLNEKGDEAKKALDSLGLDATKLDGLFTPAPAAEITGDKPAFTLYTFEGKPIDATGAAKPDANGVVDLSSLYPAMADGGTFVLAWKDATPLVIEALRNPLPWEKLKSGEINLSQRENFIKEFAKGKPVITHIVPLQQAVITTDKGVIKAKFSYDVAPHTIDNFVDLAKQKFYDGSAFHRVMPGFMIQGGDSLATSPDRAGSGGPGYNITAELNDKKHERGTLSMARQSFSVDTEGSQFFIMHAKSPHLDGDYTAFGDVTDGMDIVDAIAKTPTVGNNGEVRGDRPKIISVQIAPATLAGYGLKK